MKASIILEITGNIVAEYEHREIIYVDDLGQARFFKTWLRQQGIDVKRVVWSWERTSKARNCFEFANAKEARIVWERITHNAKMVEQEA
jgi:hypothetical protein